MLGYEDNMKKYSIIIIVFLLAGSLYADEDILNYFEAKIIALALETSFEDKGYTVVEPQTKLSHMDCTDAEDAKKSKEYIKKKLKIEGYDITPALNDLFNKNKRPIRLNLKSKPAKGYIIDYENKYRKYFNNDGGGWDKWYKENPKAHGSTAVSRPAYDKNNGIVLIYKGTQSHWLAGAGYIIAYKYDGIKLKELGRVMLWIS